ncbi:MAG: polysaccharide biosynthesis protein [Pseudomonadota bacterium]
MFDGRTLLISGGTGSFGHAVLERFLQTDIGEIRIFSRDEKKQDDMRWLIKDSRIRYYIGDVRDYQSLLPALIDVDYVFQAAALKQVPSCEFYPLEAYKTNVLGTENMLNAAIANGVKKVVVLSTDKAVYPINAMGLSKAMMEKVTVAKARFTNADKTAVACTRYGNVMASRGSVIPLFVNQIQRGEPLTVTDPNMTRFLMSLDDAVELAVYAFANVTHGDIFVQKAPASTIGDLANALLHIFRANNPIDVIGTRHGEKLYETLLTREELASAEDRGGYYRIPSDNRDLNYGKYFSDGKECVSATEDYNSHNTERLSIPAVTEKLLTLPFIQRALTERHAA